MAILFFIIILALLVFIHELGHFLAAKYFGMRVDSFAIGFPPTLFKWKRGETTYKINAIPFGGYVSIHGENPEEPDTIDPRSMNNKPKRQQIVVLVAGVLMNFLAGWVALAIAFMIGIPSVIGDLPKNSTVTNQSIIITDVAPDSAAETAGLLVSDRIISYQGQPVDSPETLSALIASGTESEMVMERDGEPQTFVVDPTYNSELDSEAIGIAMTSTGLVKTAFFPSIWQGLKQAGIMTASVAEAFWNLIAGAFTGDAKIADLSGPVGIVGVVGDAASLGFTYVLTLTALISLNLAVLNLIPFPALDGGRILFIIIEKIKGSPIKPQVSTILNLVGFAILILLMVAVTVSDVIKLV